MATREEIEEIYDFMDEIFRVSFGEHANRCTGYVRRVYDSPSS